MAEDEEGAQKPGTNIGKIFGKYLADYQDIRRITMIFGGLP